ncbi:MAG: DUF4041 domain-containing protein [Clostridia bacterium]|nr:DUF4041 domain-containing protein [Clostridia bacterium]
MGLLDLFKATENENLRKELDYLKSKFSPEQLKILDLEKQILKLDNAKTYLDKELTRLNNDIEEKKKLVIQLDDDILFQDFSLYKPIYDFATSEEYKDKLNEIRNKQKESIKNKTAVSFSSNWTVNGSKSQGKKMINDSVKQILRTFNIECENVIDRVKFNNYDSMKARIHKSYNSLNNLNSVNQIHLNQKYLDYKLNELALAYEYQRKKQEEKEEQKKLRAELREQAQVQKELEEARKNTLKDKEHYEKAINKINSQLETETDENKKNDLLQKKSELEAHLNEIIKKLEDIDYRQKNQKAGYVYIISNIGSFGENVYKIGMTRRLDPEDRIDELSDASVPFNFDIHAMIFTEDAPALEAALHKAFENKKVNMINHRREFFNVTLEEIKEVVTKNFDKTVEFINTPTAEQYRETRKIKEQLTKDSN